MRKRKQSKQVSEGLPCIHVRIPKRNKDIQVEIVEPATKKVLWEKSYPKGTDVEAIIEEARRFKPAPVIRETTNPAFCGPIFGKYRKPGVQAA